MKKTAWVVFLAGLLFLGGCGNKAEKEQLLEAEALVQEQSYEEALDLFEALEQTGVELRRVYRGIGISYMGLEQYQDAIEALEKSLEQAGGRVSDWEYDTNYYLAMAQEKAGLQQEAITTWTNLLSVKEEAEGYYNRGFLYLQEGEEEKARADFDRAVALDESGAVVLQIWETVQDTDAELGTAYLKQLTEGEAKSGEALYYQGLAYKNLQDTQQAAQTLEAAVKKGYSRANLALGELYNEMGSYEQALACYQAYRTENSDSEEAYEELMEAQMVQEDYSGALETLEEAQQAMDITGKRLYWYEIICYEYMGEYDTACDKAAAYVEAWPQEEEAAREYVFLQTR